MAKSFHDESSYSTEQKYTTRALSVIKNQLKKVPHNESSYTIYT